jgi:hypothetical protein
MTTVVSIDNVIAMGDAEKENVAAGDGGSAPVRHTQDDNEIMQTLLREAADDRDVPSLDRWLVFRFSGKAVEDAYQAGQAHGKVMAVVAGAPLLALWALINAGLGNALSTAQVIGAPQWVTLIILILLLSPLCFYLLSGAPYAGEAAKRRNLIYWICALHTVLLLLSTGAFFGKPSSGRTPYTSATHQRTHQQKPIGQSSSPSL